MIYNRFLDKKVGEVDAIKGQLDDVTIKRHCLKVPNYTMMLMSSYGTLEWTYEEKTRNYQESNQNIVKKIKYPELAYNYYQYRDSIDVHYFSKMFPIAIEEIWKTTRWAYRVFCFLLAVTEVNCRLVLTNVYNPPECSQQDFRKGLPRELLQYKFQLQSQSQKTQNQGESINQTIVCFHCPKIVHSEKTRLCATNWHTYSLYVLDKETAGLRHTAPTVLER